MTKKHIVIDARLYGPKHTGIGRYTKNLLLGLTKLKSFKHDNYTLLIYPELEKEIRSDLGNFFNYKVTTIRHYSLADQLVLPRLIKSLHPDLVHFTHLDKPIMYLSPSVVTVHDLIRHFSRGSATTTKTPILYWFKYLGYLLMTKVVLATSHIIVPSNYWQDYLLNNFNISPQKIITTYEAVDPKIISLSPQTTKPLPPKNYLLYTGNLYPHKNIQVILSALKSLPDIDLKIICARPVFIDRIKKIATDNQVTSQVQFLGYVPDRLFPKLYGQALCLVHPALIEGFSLTGLEAMALNCPVISSDKTCLPEIYQDNVIYFDPHNASELAQKIIYLKNHSSLRAKLIKLGRQLVNQFSWQKTATQTSRFYQQILS